MPATRELRDIRERPRHSEAKPPSRPPSRSIAQAMKENWRAFRQDAPGRRFRGHYQRLRRGSAALRVLAAAAGLILVAGGVILLFLPGPGLLLLVFGFALLGGESKALAGWLDRSELRGRRWVGRARRRWRRR